MSVVKVIELIASSEKGIDDAIQNAVTEASRTIHNIDSVFVKDIKAHVKDGKITTYGVICKGIFPAGRGTEIATVLFPRCRPICPPSSKSVSICAASPLNIGTMISLCTKLGTL